MTKQELEKAIENKDTIWYIDSLYDTPKDMLLHGIYEINSYIYEDVGRVYYLKDVERNSYYRIDYIFKTQAQAKHYSYRSNIARLETLPFLTWEEFKEIGQISFIGKDKKEYILKKDIIWSNNKYTLVDCLKIFNETDFTFSKYFDYTEANFYKAYDECVKLFKEE